MTQPRSQKDRDDDVAPEIVRQRSVIRTERPSESPAAGSTGGKRLVGVDAARGVALLGMMAIHSLYTSSPDGSPTWSHTVFSGRAAAAFAVLAGIGIAFMTGRRRVPPTMARPTAAALAVRALAIGVIGLSLGYTYAHLAAVILPYYAVMFLLAIPLVFLSTRTIAAIGAVTLVAAPVFSHTVRPYLPEPTHVNLTFGHLIDHPLEILTELTFTGFYPAVPWMTYLCAGLVVGRLDLTSARVAARLLCVGAGMAAAAAASSALLVHEFGLKRILAAESARGMSANRTQELLTFGGEGTTPTSTWWWLAVDAPHTSTPFDLLGTSGSAIALLGLMLLIGQVTAPILGRLAAVVQAPLAAAGAMPLTLYTAHIAFINSRYDVFDATTGYLAQVAGVLLIGLVARAAGRRRGPLEALVAGWVRQARHRYAVAPHT